MTLFDIYIYFYLIYLYTFQDWEKKYLHENYSKIFQDGYVVETVSFF